MSERNTGKPRRIAILFCVLAAMMLQPASGAFGQGPGRVGVVVQFGGGRVLTRYLELTTPVDRVTALQATGLSIETAFGGGAICKIEGQGCPGNDAECWCQCPFIPGEACIIWMYFPMNATGDGWGDINTWPLPELEEGHVSGWAWGEVEWEAWPWVPLVEPPFFTVDQIHDRALAPRVVYAIGGANQLTVTAAFGGDSDGSGSAVLRCRTTGGMWGTPQAMPRDDSSFVLTLTGLDPGEYEVEVTYRDYTSGVLGENGRTSFTFPLAKTRVVEAETVEEEFVPEPGTVLLLGSGLASLAGYAGLRLRALRKKFD